MKRTLVLFALVALSCTGRGTKALEDALASGQQAARAGDLARALDIVDTALARTRVEVTSDRVWKLRLLRGDVLISRGDGTQAEPILTATLPSGATFDALRARQRMLQARVLNARDQRSEALDLLAQARPLVTSDLESLLDLELLTGQLELQSGRWHEAESRLVAVLERSERASDRFRQLQAVNNLGMGGLVRRYYDRALDWFERGLTYSDLEETSVYAAVRNNAGLCYARLGLFDRAIDIQRRAVALYERRDVKPALPQALGTLGNTFLLSGRPDEGLPYLQRAFEVAQQGQLEHEAALWAGNLASALIEVGRWDEAGRFNQQERDLTPATKGSTLVHNLLDAARIAAGRGDLPRSRTLFTTVLENQATDPPVRWTAQVGLANLAVDEQRWPQATQYFEAALETVEHARSDFKLEYRLSFLTHLISFYRQYVDFLITQGHDERALEIADSSRSRVLAERQHVPAPIRASGSSLRQLAHRSRAVLLSYWLGPERSYLWIVTRRSTRRVDLPPAATIEAAVREFRAAIEQSTADPLTIRDTPGDRLYRMILEPAQVPVGASVVIVPDGALHGVNFETLPVDGSPRRFFIEDAEIQVAPSLSLLGASTRPYRSSKRGGVLLIGNPTPRAPEFPALSYAPTEMTSIVRRFPPGDVTAFEGERASPTVFRSQPLDRFSIIHFTAHATTSVESPLDSAVVLSGPDHAYKLYARDVAETTLDADLVTVSACRSAGERAYAGEGLVGFAWAFLRAGARRVIAGLWDVDDLATARLMDTLYEGLSRQERPATALRAAKLAMIEAGGRTARPYYWGALQLYSARLD